jgi:arginyl-tRNA synthetase
MTSILTQLNECFARAVAEGLGATALHVQKWLAPASDAQFGDYQFNGAMPLAKQLKAKPRDLAAKVVAALDLSGIADPPGIAGPGFINLKLTDQFLCDGIAALLGDERLGVEPAPRPQHVVVDFSSPNLAKEMHVGHLRSTIIGDAIARLLEFEGHNVSRINHVGDFGGLGLLIQYVRETQPDVATNPGAFHVSDLEEFYRQAREKELNDPAFAEAARLAIVDLQRKEPTAVALWRAFRAESLRHCRQIYDRLGVRLETVGESDYLDELPGVVDALRQKELIVEDKGAQCIFLDGFKNRDGEPLPMIVQKTDGGYLYATTDLAAIRRRAQKMNADRIVYVTDSRQRQHFDMVFAAARAAGFVGQNVRLDHVGFGMMLGADRRPFKTRTGGTVKLAELLDEAEERALNLIRERGQTYSTLAEGKRKAQTPEQQAAIARAVGLGAVKYADLSQDLTSDYVFSWDKMLSFDGNTAPYMMYAYARIRSVFDRANVDPAAGASARLTMRITHPSERALMLKLLQFPDLMESITDTWRIHELPNYLFTLANVFMGLYQDKANWPILEAEPAVRDARLALCGVTANALKLGLGLLGIDVVDQM